MKLKDSQHEHENNSVSRNAEPRTLKQSKLDTLSITSIMIDYQKAIFICRSSGM